MSTTPDADAVRNWKPLTPQQRRVLGVLVEKAKTTPAGYPMSANAVVVGCNQKNNREPVTSYDDIDVGNALGELQEMGAVKEIDWMGRVPKYKHLAHEWLGVRPVELAILTELMLRGPQAMGELRARASRMEAIEDLSALKLITDGLVARGLMLELTPPGRGQLVTHALYAPDELAQVRAGGHTVHHDAGVQPEPAPRRSEPSHDIAAQIAELRAQIAQLEERLEQLERR